MAGLVAGGTLGGGEDLYVDEHVADVLQSIGGLPLLLRLGVGPARELTTGVAAAPSSGTAVVAVGAPLWRYEAAFSALGRATPRYTAVRVLSCPSEPALRDAEDRPGGHGGGATYASLGAAVGAWLGGGVRVDVSHLLLPAVVLVDAPPLGVLLAGPGLRRARPLLLDDVDPEELRGVKHVNDLVGALVPPGRRRELKGAAHVLADTLCALNLRVRAVAAAAGARARGSGWRICMHAATRISTLSRHSLLSCIHCA